MINSNKVKTFWDSRSKKLKEVPYESIANLEENPELLKLKIELEQKKIMPLLQLTKDKTILDLGAGVGQWTFRFSPLVKKVVAVEYAAGLADIGRQEAVRRKESNVEFVTSAAEDYCAPEPFDVVFISGLFVYLSNEQADRLIARLLSFVKPDGLVMVRDGSSILPHRHEINDRFSSILNAYYSATYRTRSEYADLFARGGFQIAQDGQMFDEGTPLNKFPETRLWYFVLRSAKG